MRDEQLVPKAIRKSSSRPPPDDGGPPFIAVCLFLVIAIAFISFLMRSCR